MSTPATTETAPATGTPGTGHGAHGAHKPGAIHIHVVSPGLLLTVYGVLLVLTVATVAVTNLELGAFNVWAALGIAVAKAGLVALFFMHLRWDAPFNAIVLMASLLFVALFIGIAVLDSKNYKVNYDAPGRGQVLIGSEVP